MALEVKVFRDLGAYRAKAWFGMTGRQFIALSGVVALVIVGIVLTSLLSLPDWTQYVLFALIIPLAVWGWGHPMGLDVEEYLRDVKDFHNLPRQFTYAEPCGACVNEQARGLASGSTHDAKDCAWRAARSYAPQLDVKAKKVRKNVNVFETKN